ncbi:MAG TPA: cupin domain-containing protein [Candidatus Brocadiaceae bacterium]
MQGINPIGAQDSPLVRIDEIKEFRTEGFVRKRIFQTENLHFNIYCIDVGQKNALHKHPISDEVLYFIEGEGECVVGEKVYQVKGRTTILVPKDIPHSIVNTGNTPMLCVLAQAPLPCEHVPVKE